MLNLILQSSVFLFHVHSSKDINYHLASITHNITRLLMLMLLCSSTFISVSFGQQDEVFFRSLYFEKGMEPKTVNAVLEGIDGFVYLATRRGLCRYDGYEFKYFRYEHDNDASIAGNEVTSFYEDRSGYLWVGTRGTGDLSRYDKKTETFKRFNISDAFVAGEQVIQVIKEDQPANQYLWLGTWGALVRFDRFSGRYEYFPLPNNTPEITTIVRDIHVTDSTIWIAVDSNADNKGLWKFDRQRKKFERVIPNNNPDYNISLSCLFADQRFPDDLWLGTMSDGVYFYNTAQNMLIPAQHSLESINDNRVNTITRLDNDDIWIGTDLGIYTYKNFQTPLVHYTNTNENYSLTGTIIKSIHSGKRNDVWIGMDGGGVNYLVKRKDFHHYTDDPTDQTDLPGNRIRAVYSDSQGQLWVDADGLGVSRYDKKREKWYHYHVKDSLTNGFDIHSVWNFYEDSRGIVWMTTPNNKLYEYNRLKDSFQGHEVHFDGRDGGLIQMVQEDFKGNLWVATNNGIFLFDPNRKLFFQHYKGAFGKPLMTEIQPRGMFIDQEQNVWVGTWRNGLFRISLMNKDYDQPVYHNWQHEKGNSETVSSNSVISVYRDKIGFVWAGTYGAGVDRFDPTNGRFTHYNETDGLSNNVVLALQEDRSGNIWMSTLSGLSRMSPLHHQFRNFYEKDGLLSNEFYWGASYKDVDGKMYWGTTNGVVYFHPDSIISNTTTPDIVITSLHNGQETLDFGVSPVYLDEVQLPHTITNLFIDFRALEYTDPSKNQYAYQLEGFDKDWNYFGSRNFAQYTNLDPGNYIFKVKASNNDGVWNETPLLLMVSITSPWWESFYTRIVILIFVALGFYMVFSVRTQVLKARQLELEKQVVERTTEVTSKNEELVDKHKELQLVTTEVQQQNEELQHQADEILAQRDQIMQQHQALSAMFSDLQEVSEIGKKITSMLSFDQILYTVYTNVRKIMNADEFAIGVYDKFRKGILLWIVGEDGEPHQRIDLSSNKSKLTVWCYHNMIPVFINNYKREAPVYLKEIDPDQPENSSLIYLPLFSKGEQQGIIAVQTNRANAYEKKHLTLFQAFAAYVATALDNSRAYDTIKMKNELITKSIRYAKTIQQAILPPTERLNNIFKAHFVIYKPKDIVSGDFFWYQSVEDEEGDILHFVAVADCTGHGVPGAFMSMISTRILDEVVLQKRIHKPKDILAQIDTSIRIALNQDNTISATNRDGMDIAICRIKFLGEDKAELIFTGAKSDIYIKPLAQEGINRLRGDRKSLGGSSSQEKNFNEEYKILSKGDRIFFSTDGFVDQNNPARGKFGLKRFTTMLESNAALEMSQQKKIYEKELRTFRAGSDQRDDITVFGVEL